MRPQMMLSVCLAAAVAALGSVPGPAAEPRERVGDFVEIRDAERHREHRAMPEYRRLCSFCHGDEGRGDGLNAFSLRTRPPDFTEPGWGRSKTIDGLVAVIRDGGRASGLSPDMPAWGQTLEPSLVRNLADLVLSFGGAAR